MQGVGEQEQEIEIFENDIDAYLTMFCEECNPPIEDMGKERQGKWNAALIYIQRHVFPDKSILKLNSPLDGYVNNNCDSGSVYSLNNSNCNAYDINKVNKICDYYIYLCYKYDKEISITGFCKLTGINPDTIHDWGNEINKLSTSGCDIYKKLSSEREESLTAKLVSNSNPVAIIAILNKHFGYNMPGVREQKQEQRLASREELGLEAPKERPALPGTGGND